MDTRARPARAAAATARRPPALRALPTRTQRPRASVQPGQVEQVVHLPAQLPRFVHDRFHHPALRRQRLIARLLQQARRGHPDGRQRRAQVVGDRRRAANSEFAPSPPAPARRRTSPAIGPAPATGRSDWRTPRATAAHRRRVKRCSCRGRTPSTPTMRSSPTIGTKAAGVVVRSLHGESIVIGHPLGRRGARRVVAQPGRLAVLQLDVSCGATKIQRHLAVKGIAPPPPPPSEAAFA